MKYTELKRGMMIKNHGLIISVDLEGLSKFWGNKPNITFYSIHDSFGGTMHMQAQENKNYEFMCETGSRSYKRAVRKILFAMTSFRVEAQKSEKELKSFL